VIPGDLGVLATIGSMLAVVWHYWIAVVLVLTAVIPATVMMFANYLRKTQAPKYGRDE
jgi:hypothetical protein